MGLLEKSHQYRLLNGLLDPTVSHMSQTGSFPTASILVSGSATIQVATNQSITAGWGDAYFKLSTTVGAVNYFRKHVNMSFVYSVY